MLPYCSKCNLCLLLFFQKRPVPSDSVDRIAVKRQRFADQRLQGQPAANGLLPSNGHSTAAHALPPSYHSKTDLQRTSSLAANQNGSLGGPNGFPLMHKLSGVSESQASECREQETKESNHQPRQGDSDQQLAASQHRKKKSKKHKDKERERLKEKKASEWLRTSPDLKQKQDKLDSKPPFFTKII